MVYGDKWSRSKDKLWIIRSRDTIQYRKSTFVFLDDFCYFFIQRPRTNLRRASISTVIIYSSRIIIWVIRKYDVPCQCSCLGYSTPNVMNVVLTLEQNFSTKHAHWGTVVIRYDNVSIRETSMFVLAPLSKSRLHSSHSTTQITFLYLFSSHFSFFFMLFFVWYCFCLKFLIFCVFRWIRNKYFLFNI